MQAGQLGVGGGDFLGPRANLHQLELGLLFGQFALPSAQYRFRVQRAQRFERRFIRPSLLALGSTDLIVALLVAVLLRADGLGLHQALGAGEDRGRLGSLGLVLGQRLIQTNQLLLERLATVHQVLSGRLAPLLGTFDAIALLAEDFRARAKSQHVQFGLPFVYLGFFLLDLALQIGHGHVRDKRAGLDLLTFVKVNVVQETRDLGANLVPLGGLDFENAVGPVRHGNERQGGNRADDDAQPNRGPQMLLQQQYDPGFAGKHVAKQRVSDQHRQRNDHPHAQASQMLGPKLSHPPEHQADDHNRERPTAHPIEEQELGMRGPLGPRTTP